MFMKVYGTLDIHMFSVDAVNFSPVNLKVGVSNIWVPGTIPGRGLTPVCSRRGVIWAPMSH